MLEFTDKDFKHLYSICSKKPKKPKKNQKLCVKEKLSMLKDMGYIKKIHIKILEMKTTA